MHSDESPLKHWGFAVHCNELCSLANSLIINNKVQMYMQCKIFVHHTVQTASLIITGVFFKECL